MKEIGIFSLLWLLQGSYCSFQYGKKPKNTFAVLKGPFGLKQCIKECLLQKSCQTLGYHRDQLRCELGDSKEVLPVSDQRFTTAFRSQLSDYQPLLESCANHNCELLQRCVARKSGDYKCVMPEDYVCQKIYFEGIRSIGYDTAENQCQSDGGRLMIMDKMWKIDITAHKLTAGDATSSNHFIVNGFKNENGRWAFSDGREFVQVENVDYTLNAGKYVSMTRYKLFRANERYFLVYGFVCEL